MRKTKIVCTIGPATKEVEVLKNLMKAGMNVARINFSHGSYPEQKVYIDAVKQAREELNLPIAMMLDMQGPEVRTGIIEEEVVLKEGDPFVLLNEDIVGDSKKVSISYKDLYQDVKQGNTILINDGAIELKVEKIIEKDIYCIVVNGDKLGSRKSINVPYIHMSLPTLSDKDIQDLKDAGMAGFDYIAASFVRNKEDILQIRSVLDENGGEKIKIISKIENQEGIDNFNEILDISDGIMIARGDMGVEIPMEQVPVIQKQFIKDCNRVGKIVITATQMLESMITSPRPTRAEVSDVANAIYDSTGAIMLSAESALGKYPVECVETMSRIAETIESNLKYWKRFKIKEYNLNNMNYEFDLNYSICEIAMNMKAKAIYSYTEKGDTPRIISSFLPKVPIIAVTPNEQTYRQLAFVWNVHPILIKDKETVNEVLKEGIKIGKEYFLQDGDTIVITGGTLAIPDINTSVVNRMIGGVIKI